WREVQVGGERQLRIRRKDAYVEIVSGRKPTRAAEPKRRARRSEGPSRRTAASRSRRPESADATRLVYPEAPNPSRGARPVGRGSFSRRCSIANKGAKCAPWPPSRGDSRTGQPLTRRGRHRISHAQSGGAAAAGWSRGL